MYIMYIQTTLLKLPGGGRDSQRLVGYARLLSELYNYAVVGSPTIFDTLHLLLDSGHEVRLVYPIRFYFILF